MSWILKSGSFIVITQRYSITCISFLSKKSKIIKFHFPSKKIYFHSLIFSFTNYIFSFTNYTTSNQLEQRTRQKHWRLLMNFLNQTSMPQIQERLSRDIHIHRIVGSIYFLLFHYLRGLGEQNALGFREQEFRGLVIQ